MTHSHRTIMTHSQMMMMMQQQKNTQMMMMMMQQNTQITMMHPQSCRVMKKKRQQMSKRKKTTTPTPTTTTTTTTSYSEPSLPDDIIFSHILPKLPVRSLLRFDCVSKLWYNTIHHDPKFHASHFTHTKSNPSLVAMLCQKATLICFLQLLKEGGGGHQYHPDSNNSIKKNNNNIASLELESGSSLIVGTCNGLTCNTIPPAIQICNPSTRELLNFPGPKPTTLTERSAAVRKGFGFDPLMNEYKVINLWYNYHGYYDCRVYTLGSGTNKWRDVTATCDYPPYCYPDDSKPVPIGGIPFYNIIELAPICISGTLFWKTNMKSRILSFDLHHEKFHLIATPKVPQGSILHTLFELEGRLCLVYRYDDDLKKDEVQLTLFTCKDHQQLRLVHIAASSGSGSGSGGGGGATWIRSWFMCLPLKAEEIKLIRFVEFAKHVYLHWVTTDGRFILWDVNTNKWIHNKLLGLDQTQWVLLVNHVENLLSLKTFMPPSAGGGEVEVKYFSSRDAKHEIPDGEMKKKKRRRIVHDSHGYRTTPYWLSNIII